MSCVAEGIVIEALKDVPDYVIAIACHGHVTKADYESVLIPDIEDKLTRHQRLRIYCEIAHDYIGLDPGAVWEDTKVGFSHLRDWERAANGHRRGMDETRSDVLWWFLWFPGLRGVACVPDRGRRQSPRMGCWRGSCHADVACHAWPDARYQKRCKTIYLRASLSRPSDDHRPPPPVDVVKPWSHRTGGSRRSSFATGRVRLISWRRCRLKNEGLMRRDPFTRRMRASRHNGSDRLS